MKKKRIFTTILVSLLSLLLVLLVGCGGSGNQPSDGSGKKPSGEQGGGGAVVDTRPLLTLSSNIENAGTLTGGGHYSYNDDLRIKATVNSGYHFLGWYNGNDLLSTSAEYNCKMWDKSVTLEAKFIAVPKEQSGNLGTGDLINKKFTLCVKSSSPLLGKINVNDNGNIEEYTLETTAGTNIKALSLTISSQAFLGWFDEAGNLVMANGVFEFAMPPFDYTLTAKWDCDCKEYIYNSERGCLVCTVCGGEDKNNESGWVIQENVLTKYKGSGTSVTIPEGVLSIGERAFSGCTGLTSVTIPASVTSIGGYAFSDCTGLQSVTFGENSQLTSIGNNAFSGCTGLTSMTLPFVGASLNGTRNTHFGYIFGAGSYSSNKSYVPTSLKTVVITGGSTIGSSAFYYCSGLTSITILDSVTSIGYGAFSGCTGLTGVYITDIAAWCNISFGDAYANPLYYAKNLYLNGELVAALTIPTGVTSIGSGAFYNCESLTSITIPDSVTSIGKSAFAYCTGLTRITIPASVTSIGYGAFYGCRGLQSVTFGKNNWLKSIGKYAFYNCKSLTSITIPEGVTSIGESAFYYCSGLTSITVPDSVTLIDYDAFDCTGLEKVYYGGTASWWSRISIDSSNYDLTSATRYYYSANAPTTSGNYWHYDGNGNVVEW